jgi:hypothetical protein
MATISGRRWRSPPPPRPELKFSTTSIQAFAAKRPAFQQDRPGELPLFSCNFDRELSNRVVVTINSACGKGYVNPNAAIRVGEYLLRSIYVKLKLEWSPDSAPRGPFNGAKRLDFNRNTTGKLNAARIEPVFPTVELALEAEVSSVLTTVVRSRYKLLVRRMRYPQFVDKSTFHQEKREIDSSFRVFSTENLWSRWSAS